MGRRRPEPWHLATGDLVDSDGLCVGAPGGSVPAPPEGSLREVQLRLPICGVDGSDQRGMGDGLGQAAAPALQSSGLLLNALESRGVLEPGGATFAPFLPPSRGRGGLPC